MASTGASCLPYVMPVVVGILRADSELLELLNGPGPDKIFTLAPPNVTRPYLWLLSGAEAPQNTMGRYGRVAQIELVAVSGFSGTEDVDRVIGRAMTLLDRSQQELTFPGYGTGRMQWTQSDRSVLTQGLYDNQPEFQRRALFTVSAG